MTAPFPLFPDLTLDWPAGKTFQLAYDEIRVYNLRLQNSSDDLHYAMEVSCTSPGCLLRPSRFLVPAAGERAQDAIYLTLAFQPGVAFGEEVLKRQETLTLKAILLTLKEVEDTCVDLESVFTTPPDISVPLNLTFTYDQAAGKKEAVYKSLSIYPVDVPRLLFNVTTPGYLTAYLFLDCPLSVDAHKIAWRLSLRYPFWYSVRNTCTPGSFQGEVTQYDQYAFGYLSPGQTHFTYLDLKASGETCFKKGQAFMLETVKLGVAQPPEVIRQMAAAFRRPFEEKDMRTGRALSHDLRENFFEKKDFERASPGGYRTPCKFFPSAFAFDGPYNQRQSASLTLTNESKAHILVYRLQAQEPSLFTQEASKLGKLLTVPAGRQSEPFIVELINLEAYFNVHPGAKLNRNQLFRLDTFLLDKETKTEADYWQAMMRSMDARQMETTFIPCHFNDEQAIVAAEKGQVYTPPVIPHSQDFMDAIKHPLANFGVTGGRPPFASTQTAQQVAIARMTSAMNLIRGQSPGGQSFTPHTGQMAPFPGATMAPMAPLAPMAPMAPLAPFNPPARNPPIEFNDQVTGLPISLLCNQIAASPINQTTESPLHRKLKLSASSPETPEAASKPSTVLADKQMAIVDNKASPETAPSKLAIASSSLPTTAPTEAQRKSAAPTPNSSVLRTRHMEKKKPKKRVSPKGPSTHRKAASPKPGQAKSPPMSPSKAPRHHASPRSLPSRAPFAPVADPGTEDMVALFNLVLALAICLILLNALITNLA